MPPAIPDDTGAEVYSLISLLEKREMVEPPPHSS